MPGKNSISQKIRDMAYMKQALVLAAQGLGNTSPNPAVGALVVAKGGAVIGRGFHEKAGLPHAEINALRDAKKHAPRSVRGSTLYVTLEPCDHYGKTPPCTDAIIRERIARVVIAMRDPNPLVAGRGIRKLKSAGVSVALGSARCEAERLNEAYRKYITTGMPFVTVKVAQSLDGKIATRKGDSRWISSPKARQFGHHLRVISDAVLVGAGTLMHDDPLLTARDAHGKIIRTRQPLRIVLDPDLCITPAHRIFSHSSPLLIATTGKASPQKKRFLSTRFPFVEVRSFGARTINLRALMRYAASREIVSLLVEGGGSTIARFFKEGLVDKAFFVIAPKIIGGKEAITAVEGKGAAYVKDALSGITRSLRVCGDEIIWEVEF